ncbi:hypothetical protein Moror_6047 [Moniliophthora roreri MCA 2997]|nr:hypothetical protein Moror_6047 [Moniliophthora roreri MCA 2997]
MKPDTISMTSRSRVIDSASANAYLAVNNSNPVIHMVGQAQEEKLYLKIIAKGSSDVSIGPMEYCGNAFIVKGPAGKTVLSLCFEDPTLKANLLEWEA